MQRVKGNGGCMRKTMCGGLFVSAATQVLMHKRCLSAPEELYQAAAEQGLLEASVGQTPCSSCLLQGHKGEEIKIPLSSGLSRATLASGHGWLRAATSCP